MVDILIRVIIGLLVSSGLITLGGLLVWRLDIVEVFGVDVVKVVHVACFSLVVLISLLVGVLVANIVRLPL